MPLYDLPFGEKGATVDRDLQPFIDKMAQVVTSLKHYESLRGRKGFASKSRVLTVNGLKLVASANTPVDVAVDDTQDVTLMIPFAGQNKSTFGNQAINWSAQTGACFLPAMGRGGQSTSRSTLTLTLNPEKLNATVRSMCGRADQKVEVLDRPMLIPSKQGDVQYLQVFKKLCGLIDAAHLDPFMLELQGIDDVFYRTIAMMLFPDILTNAKNRHLPSKGAVDRACDFAMANLSERLTLTKLENISGVSQRSLQNAFVERFGTSPMQWVKHQRLSQAQKLLSDSTTIYTVTEVATSLGFTNLGNFAADYKKQFGCSPSDVIKSK